MSERHWKRLKQSKVMDYGGEVPGRVVLEPDEVDHSYRIFLETVADGVSVASFATGPGSTCELHPTAKSNTIARMGHSWSLIILVPLPLPVFGKGHLSSLHYPRRRASTRTVSADPSH
jgi:hypothetical protein